MDRILILRTSYGALCGLLDVANRWSNWAAEPSFVHDYEKIFKSISKCIDLDIQYLSPQNLTEKNGDYAIGSLRSKMSQLKSILEHGYNITDKIIQIGSLFNSIKDEQLRSRCADLLTAHDHFDRVVNQATQILEDRIKQKSRSSKSGKQLINEVIKPDLGATVLILSNDSNEQEGYSNILRGLMQTFRNSTHHGFSSPVSREDAFAICGFIDQLLRIVDHASHRVG